MKRLLFALLFAITASLCFGQTISFTSILDTSNVSNAWQYSWDGSMRSVIVADSAPGYVSLNNSYLDFQLYKRRIVLGDTLEKQVVVRLYFRDIRSPLSSFINSTAVKSKLKVAARQNAIRTRLSQE